MGKHEQVLSIEQKTLEERIFDLECQVSMLIETISELKQGGM
jgi:uncharacterized coiled-coil protein SlyX